MNACSSDTFVGARWCDADAVGERDLGYLVLGEAANGQFRHRCC